MALPEEQYVNDVAAMDPRRFELAVRRLTDALDPGLDASQFVGSGLDYVQSRPWAEGDDVRSIDHRVTARSGQVYVKEYESLRGTPIMLVLDASRSMHIGIGRPGKYQVACAIAAGLGSAGLRRGSAVGMEVCHLSAPRLQPTRSQGALLALVRQLPGLPPDCVEAGDEDTEGGLAQTLAGLPGRLRRRHLVMVLSDLHGVDVVSALRRIQMAHDCVVIRPVDPSERQAPAGGLMWVNEAETGRAGLQRGMPEVDVDGPVKALLAVGIDCCALDIERPWMASLVSFLRLRNSAKGVTR